MPFVPVPEFSQLHRHKKSEPPCKEVEPQQIQQAFRFRYRRPEYFQCVQDLSKRRTFAGKVPELEASEKSVVQSRESMSR